MGKKSMFSLEIKNKKICINRKLQSSAKTMRYLGRDRIFLYGILAVTGQFLLGILAVMEHFMWGTGRVTS